MRKKKKKNPFSGKQILYMQFMWLGVTTDGLEHCVAFRGVSGKSQREYRKRVRAHKITKEPPHWTCKNGF